MLRAAFVMAALDAGVPLRDVRLAARHADPRTTTIYDRRRQNLDRHAADVVVARCLSSTLRSPPTTMAEVAGMPYEASLRSVLEPAIGASLMVRRDHARLLEDMFARWSSDRAGPLAIRTGTVKA
jgi:hypothetical protein